MSIEKDKLINHEDGLNIISALQMIKSSYGMYYPKPYLINSTIPYTEGETVNILDHLIGYNPDKMLIYGDVTASEQKKNTCYITLKSMNDRWLDGSGEKFEIEWNTIKIVSWTSGTDEEIVAMIQAADAGKIDLTDYWNVGNIRLVQLSAMSATGVGESHVAQTIGFTLVAKDTGIEDYTNPCYNYQYVDDSKVRKYPSFIVQQGNTFGNGSNNEYGYMNSSNTNSGSWNGSARRTWCNSVYKNAVPSTIVDIFKQVKVKTIATYNGSSMQESSDYFFLPAEKEVFGSRSYSNTTEADALSIWPYYSTSANRIIYNNSSGSANGWWERSPRSNYSTDFCFVNSDGSVNGVGASNALGLAPAGCI